MQNDGHLRERVAMAGTKPSGETKSRVSLARGHKVEEPGGRVSSERPIDVERRVADPLSPVTSRPLAGPQGHRLSPALPQSPSAARHGPDGRPDHLAISQTQ